jgi:hypothetical protein
MAGAGSSWWLEEAPRAGVPGYLDERSAYREMARVIGEVETEQ